MTPRRIHPDTFTEGNVTFKNFHTALEWIDEVCPIGYDDMLDEEINLYEQELAQAVVDDVVDGLHGDCRSDGDEVMGVTEVVGVDDRVHLIWWKSVYGISAEDWAAEITFDVR